MLKDRKYDWVPHLKQRKCDTYMQISPVETLLPAYTTV